MLRFWENESIFQKLVKKNEDKPRWSFLDGPITANNPMGVHHAWGRTYKDLYQRYHAMNGHQLRYQNGFDCQGLWVEVEVEKELGFENKRDIEEYGIDRFVQKCKERVIKYSEVQTEQSIRLGYWMDWDNSYYTMSEENNYTIWHFLKQINERDMLYQGEDVMPWCPRCGTALSEHEIATEGYKEITHPSIYVKFPLVDRENESLLVWTTTPWTLSSNVAAAVKEDLDYIKVSDGEEAIYLAKERQEILDDKWEIVEELKGKELLGLQYEGPFDELPVQEGIEHKVIPWEEVSEDDGSGIVHIAPGCGREDFQLSKEFDLAVIAPLDEAGVYLEGFDWLSGQAAADITKDIFKNLKEKGRLFHREQITHRYPVCWRCGTEVVFRLVDEWFIDMDEIRYDIMEVAKQINWIPSYGLDHELDWLRNMDDWNISKKRYWGLALPIWECDDCDTFSVVGSKGELYERAVEGWDKFEGHTPHKPHIDKVKIECEECGGQMTRVPDVGNPWLDAGIVPYSTMHYLTNHEYWEKWFPADFVTESLPGQFRNWFYSLLAMSTVLENEPPFKTLLGHALVKDEHGEEMHKSSGNSIPFDEAADHMGVDVMRWIYATQNPVQNLNFGYSIADEIRKRILTLWNTYSFFVTYANIDEFHPEENFIPVEERSELDRWAIAKLHQLIQTAHKAYSEFNVAMFMRESERFIDDLSNWYVRRSRRRFWRSENDTDKYSAYHTLYESLVTLSKLLAPVVPFFTEEMYQNLVTDIANDASESIHLTAFPDADEALIDEVLIREIDTVIKVVSLGRAARNKANIKVRQPLQNMQIKPRYSYEVDAIHNLEKQILQELNIKSLEVVEEIDELVEYKVTPNFSAIGKKYGNLVPQIKAALEKTDQEAVAKQVEDGSSVTLELDQESVALLPEEIDVETVEPEDLAVVEDVGYLVAIDTEITEVLKKEGMVRDLVRYVQNMRKEAGYQVEDHIRVGYKAAGDLKEALEEHAEYFGNEVLADELSSNNIVGDYTETFTVGDNEIQVTIERV
ncbi:MAG: isoleucine--tRNA ligase [Candidatus Marinimicrobia bacterium]|nr:isoleucine--tRNA ligase [Candidatus Neomarinimicrobiota bacterium]MCF7830075.1 isoleucine--tRNA ligase [Candidatus Neomarinimicrobiota bacterium]MCF7882122.1 isoleucine--tRNA ligase [Candidatus Neomarinimicrobiota bacterium]